MENVGDPARLSSRPDARPVTNGGYIVGPRYDHLFFIWPPLAFLAAGVLIHALDIAEASLRIGDSEIYLFPTFALTFTMAHVFAVLFRSHGNREIFPLHPLRFIVVPLLLFVLFVMSELAFIVGLVFAVWFDNWHSSLQTFGLGRIYDMRAGNDARVGRRLDIGLALVVFTGPILAGVTFGATLTDFERFSDVGLRELASFPGWAKSHQAWIAWPVVVLGALYIVYYLWAYWRLARRGYRVSKQKVLLWSSLSVCSLYTWGFDSFGQAFLIMESFHSLQYFALVWWSEKRSLRRLFHVDGWRFGSPIAFTLFVGTCLLFGLWCSLWWSTRIELALFLVVEILHYWYDGFIWSVRKRQVP